MKRTLDFDLCIIARSRGQAARHAKTREKKRKSQSGHPSPPNSYITSQAQLTSWSIAYDQPTLYVKPQAPMRFREPHYIVNDQNDMTWKEDNSWRNNRDSKIQDFVTFLRFMFDVSFEPTTVEEATRTQVIYQQKQLQEQQQRWKKRIFSHWWIVKWAKINKINEELSNELILQAKLSHCAILIVHFDDVDYAIARTWGHKKKLNEWLSSKSTTKSEIQHYFELSTIVRSNDEVTMRIHMREQITKCCRNLLAKPLKNYLYDEIERSRERYNYLYLKDDN